MSLVSTLGKVAIGLIATKGIGKMMGGGSSGVSGLLGSLLGGRQQGGGLSDMLSSLGGQQSGGGLASSLGSMLGGSGGQQGLGGLLNSLGGGAAQLGGAGGLGGLLNDALQGNSSSQLHPTDEQEKQAEIMLRAMINAAKADGEIDAEEQRKITEHLGDDISAEELELVRSIMREPQDVQGLINSVPDGMGEQVYLMSLLAIDLDSKPEALYLDQLAKGLNISNQQCNMIHEKCGAPVLYS